MSSNYAIGNTPIQLPIYQSILSDFIWVLPFVDVDVDGVETPSDLTGYDFEMVIYEADGTTPAVTLTIGSGISVVDNTVTVTIDLETFSGWTRGCKYSYFFRMTTDTGLRKALFLDTFNLT